jgi:two-component system sensor histidine kinase/response regulator
MNLRRGFLTMALSLSGLLLLIGGITWAALSAFNRSTELERLRQSSLALMSETRHEVDLLGRLVHSFVSTAEPRYLHYYYDILAIREGSKARPENLSPAYWDNVIAGTKPYTLPAGNQAITLLELTQQLKFDNHEQAIVSRILLLTEGMKQIEQVAFAATQGLYDPSKAEFVSETSPQHEFANKLLHQADYLTLRADLAIAVEELSSQVDARTQSSLAHATQLLEKWITASLVMLVLTVLWLIYGYFYLRRNLLKPLTALHRTATALAGKSYDERVGHIRGVDEVITLATTIDGMAAAIEADIGQREITQRELSEARARAEVATEAKSIFLANMSHEIRTPMNAILGMAYLALKSGLPARQHEQVNKIHNAAKSLLCILNDILDFSKIEAGKIRLENIPFELEEVVRNALSMIQEQAGAKHLELILNYRVIHGKARYLGDALRLGQILINLLSNAVKFTSHGHVALDIEEIATGDELTTLRFAIQDTGIGMTPEQVERLFQEFSQGDGSTTRKYGGTGLGLSISKRLIEAMDGKILVESEVDRGSCFTFTLAFRRLSEPDTVQSHPLLQRALVVDDHPLSRENMARLLQQLGCTVVDKAADGKEALDKLQCAQRLGQAYDLLLLDWLMPGLSGRETLNELHRQNIPLPTRSIVVSAQDPSLLRDEVAGLGVFEVLQKPLLPEMLSTRSVPRLISSPAEVPLAAPAKPLAGMRILVVDDDEINRHIANELLRDWGADVVLDVDGSAAVARLLAQPAGHFDLVLMDLEMPRMNGHAATQRLRADARFATLPILAMTAYAVGRDLDQALREGMNGHIPKPFDPDKLLAILASYAPVNIAVEIPAPVTNDGPQSIKLPPSILALRELDILALSRRFHGKDEFLVRMFQRFAVEFSEFSTSLRNSIARRDTESATRQAHSLKGIAGTLGMLRLQKLALEAESSLRQTGEISAVQESELGLELAQIIIAINQIDSTAKTTAETFDPQETQSMLLLLRQHLSEADGETEALWTNHKARFAGIFSPSEMARIERAISNWNFDEALAALSLSTPRNEANS